MMLPDKWKGHDLNKIAENVHNEVTTIYEIVHGE
jgi:hypothetical protein